MDILLKNIMLADATGENVKVAAAKGGEFTGEIQTGAQAMESFPEAAAQICPDLAAVEAFLLCEGPGSMLGTRSASAFIASVAALTKAKIYTLDSMRAAAFAFAGANPGIAEFSIIAPSRKGFANLLNFSNGEIEFEREVEIAELGVLAHSGKRLLRQRKNVDAALAGMETVEFSLKEIFETAKARPELLEPRETPPDAKSLSKREYVKWKAQARI